MLNTTWNMNELRDISGLLAGGLGRGAGALGGLPPEAAMALEAARGQMNDLPDVIDNLNRALANFATTKGCLNRMMDLADLASVEDIDEAEREALQAEFVEKAKIVAADAGRQLYGGPGLNLKNVGEAKAARRVLGYLTPVMAGMGSRLAEEKSLIEEAINNTIEFLQVVAETYPEAEGAGDLNALLNATACRLAAAARRRH